MVSDLVEDGADASKDSIFRTVYHIPHSVFRIPTRSEKMASNRMQKELSQFDFENEHTMSHGATRNYYIEFTWV